MKAGKPKRAKNVGTAERIVRVLAGGTLAAWAGVELLSGPSPLWFALYVALAVLGVDFVVTGTRGYCPLYRWLGWSTARASA